MKEQKTGLFLYCRSGFESECAAEIQEQAARLGVYGYCQTKPNTGLIFFICLPEEADHIAKKIPVAETVFIRQLCVLVAQQADLPIDNRVEPLMYAINELPLCGNLWIETPDTNEGRALSGLCRSIYKPIQKAAREAGYLTEKEVANRPYMHVLFLSTHYACVGYSYSYNHAPYEMGIPRVRVPKGSPSRSAAKLAEAFKVFIPAHEFSKYVHSGQNAVDLGACPGGWTAVLVAYGMMVTAVDNGQMQPALMETGQVQHLQVDGFKYRPKKRNIQWLVCDMVEKPVRVAHLMADWIIEGYCENAIFNLKLPMKQRYAAVQQYIQAIQDRLYEAEIKGWDMQVRHLYHDREEVTVFIKRRTY